MTIGYTGAWQPKAGLLVRDTGSSSKPVSQSVKVKQMLALVGNDPTVLNTAEMDKQGLHKNIKGFDPTNVSAKQLGSLSAFLRSRGLISEITSMTLLNAGDKFDRFGIQKDRRQGSMRWSISPRNWKPSRTTISRATSTPIR